MRLHLVIATFVLAAAGSLAAQTPPPAAPAVPARPVPVMTLENRAMTSNALSTRLEQGGLVILMRHERTEVPSRPDDYSRPANDCNAQRNLSVAGIAGAAETGVAIRALQWPIGRVLSSEMCRATETARFIFNRYEIEPRLMHHDNTAERTVTVAGREMNALLADLPRGPDNTVLVSHIGNIYFAIGLQVSEGEMVVLERQANGSYVILGTIDPGYIGALARNALMTRERNTPANTPTPAVTNVSPATPARPVTPAQ
jgi:phosphohistidine phosphatase SixA